MYLGSNNPEAPYTMANSPLEPAHVLRDLGIKISKDLKWNVHVNHISKLALNRLFLLFKTIRSCDLNLLLKLYKVYVVSLLDFGSTIYNPFLKSDIATIEKVQKRFTYLLFMRCLRHTYPTIPPYNQRLSILQLDRLDIRRLKSDLKLLNQILNGEIKLNTTTQLTPGLKTHHNPLGIKVDFARSNVRYNFFLCKTTAIYIKLPPDIQILPPNQFKNTLRVLDIASYV